MALVTCRDCGKEISGEATVCIHCGCPLSNSYIPSEVFSEKKKKHVGWWAFFVLCALIGCTNLANSELVGLFFLLGALIGCPLVFGLTKIKNGARIALLIVVLFGGFILSTPPDKDNVTTSAPDSSAVINDDIVPTYQSVLNDYTKKIKDATPGLVDKYKRQAAAHKGDVSALADLSLGIIEELAIISNDGVREMAEYMMKTNGDYDEYDRWAKKLIDVYTQESTKISNAYIDSAI